MTEDSEMQSQLSDLTIKLAKILIAKNGIESYGIEPMMENKK